MPELTIQDYQNYVEYVDAKIDIGEVPLRLSDWWFLEQHYA